MKAYELAHLVTHYINKKGDTISPKKLQKLLYYLEAWYLVNFEGRSLIDEDFEAWIHGPVVPEVYHKLKHAGFNNIKVIDDEEDTADDQVSSIKNQLSEDEIGLIYAVLDKYGGLSSLELELLTHNEKPWLEARDGLAPHEASNNKISKESMKNYYSAVVNG